MKSSFKLLLILLALFCFGFKIDPTDQKSLAPNDNSNHKIVIYQVFTRLFGNTNTINKPWGTIEDNGVGKFKDFTPKALKEIKALGVTHIWFIGVLHHDYINLIFQNQP